MLSEDSNPMCLEWKVKKKGEVEDILRKASYLPS